MSLKNHGDKLKQKEKQLFFVELKDSAEVRKNLLETLKDILSFLQKFEKFRSKRHEKIENIHKLRTLLRQAHKMMGHLKAKLPQTDLKPYNFREASKSEGDIAAKPEEKRPEAIKPTTELEKLEAELEAIESKLKSLG